MKTCPICGEAYADPLTISRIDNKTEICSSCGIRQSLAPLGDLINAADVEGLVNRNKEMYRTINGT